jgi:hypothetical protein
MSRQTGQELAQTTTVGGVPTRPAGCFKTDGAGSTTTNWIYAFGAI